MLESAASALRADGAQLIDARPAVVLPDVGRLYQQFLYPILLSTTGRRLFDKMVALADSLPDDERRWCAPRASPLSANETGCSPTRNASGCVR